MDVKSFMKQCRLCSSFCDTEISIFPENKTGKKSLYSKMATCLPIKVTLDDQLPKNICLTCYRTMESMYKFYVMTVETEKKLYEQLDAIRRAFDYEQGEEIVVLPDCELNTNSIPKLEPIDFIEEVNELSFEDCFLQPDVGGNDEDTSELLNIDKENLSTIDEDKSELITEMDEQKDELRSLILTMSSDGGKREKRQEEEEELVGAVSWDNDKNQGEKSDEIERKRKFQNKVRCQRYRDKRKRINSRISQHQTITVDEEIRIKRRKEQNKQKSKRYRDKKRAANLINLQTDQPSKTIAKHVPERQYFHTSQIPGPSTRNVPYIPPTHTPI